MKTEKQIRTQLKDSKQAVKEFEKTGEDSPDLHIHEGWVEALEFVLKPVKPKLTEQVKLAKLGITPAIMIAMENIGRHYLYSNFYKNTNGIFSIVKPLKRITFDKYDNVNDPASGYYEAKGWKLKVKFGKQDDTANEVYTAVVYVAENDITEYLKDPKKNPCPEFHEEGVGNCCFDVH